MSRGWPVAHTFNCFLGLYQGLTWLDLIQRAVDCLVVMLQHAVVLFVCCYVSN